MSGEIERPRRRRNADEIDPEWAMVGVDVPAGKRLYASKDLKGTAFELAVDEHLNGEGWHLATVMQQMLIITKPTYGECLAELMMIWRNWENAGRELPAAQAGSGNGTPYKVTQGRTESRAVLAVSTAELDQAIRDLRWLAEHGALAGVNEVIRERRRQIELGWTPELDDSRVHGELMLWAASRLSVMRDKVQDGTARSYEHLEECRQAGALTAAEIDRLDRHLNRELGLSAP